MFPVTAAPDVHAIDFEHAFTKDALDTTTPIPVSSPVGFWFAWEATFEIIGTNHLQTTEDLNGACASISGCPGRNLNVPVPRWRDGKPLAQVAKSASSMPLTRCTVPLVASGMRTYSVCKDHRRAATLYGDKVWAIHSRDGVVSAGRVEGTPIDPFPGSGAHIRAQQRCETRSSHQAASVRLRIRTRLYTAQTNTNIQSTRSSPRCRSLRMSPTVLSQPKISSTRLRARWLIA